MLLLFLAEDIWKLGESDSHLRKKLWAYGSMCLSAFHVRNYRHRLYRAQNVPIGTKLYRQRTLSITIFLGGKIISDTSCDVSVYGSWRKGGTVEQRVVIGWFIENQAFTRLYDSASRLPPFPLSMKVVSHSLSSFVSPVKLTDERGGGRGWARSKIVRPRVSLVLYKSFNTLWGRGMKGW